MTKKMYNLDNEIIDIEVVRYFTNNDIDYLIYTLNEFDDAGYTKLYIAKTNNNYLTLIDDSDGGEEWTLVKDIIKQIIKNNRDGIDLAVIDLVENKLEQFVLRDSRVFKLQGNLVNLLQENKNYKKEELEDVDIFEETAEILDYQELYEEQKELNKKLNLEIELLKNKIKEVKDLLDF